MELKHGAAKAGAIMLALLGSFMAFGCFLASDRHGFWPNFITLILVVYLPYFAGWRLFAWAENAKLKRNPRARRDAAGLGWVGFGIAAATTLFSAGLNGLLLMLAVSAIWRFRRSIPFQAPAASHPGPSRSDGGAASLWQRAGRRFDGPANPFLQAVVLLVVELPEALSRRR